MEVAQRIKMIREISKNLSNYEDWNEIDLILRQFNLRTQNEWSGTKKDYVMTMVQYGSDDQLEGLNSFLLDEKLDDSGLKSENDLTKSVKQCWSEGLLYIFIAHSSLDKEEAVLLKESLLNFKVASFVAHEDIQPTETWQEEILCGLDTCHAVIAWSTPQLERSSWAQQELGIALAKNKIILSVRRGIDPIGFIAREQGIPGYKRPIEDISEDIVRILIKKSITRPSIHKAILKSFEIASSFNDAKLKIGLLEEFEVWTNDQLAILKNCLKSNSQIKSAYGVPVRIEAIIKKFEGEGANNANTTEDDEIKIEDIPF